MRRISSRQRSSLVDQYFNKGYDDENSSGGRKFRQLAIYIALLTMFSSTRTTGAECSLDLESYPYSPSSSCLYRSNSYVRWGSLMAEACCMDAFVAFAHALALRANHSWGSTSIYLDKDEMLACQNTLIQNHPELGNCSFDQFSKDGGGICNNETVDGIDKKLGKQLNTLQTACSSGTLEEGDNMRNTMACRDCFGNFTFETRVLSGGNDVPENTHDCGLALMIAMAASRIDDYQWIRSLLTCMVNKQLVNSNDSQPESSGNINKSVLAAGVVVGLLAILLVLVILVSRWTKIKKRKEGILDDKRKAVGADESRLIRFPYQEILNAMNYVTPWVFLGEGSAGKVYKGKLPSGQFIAVKHICKDIPQIDAFANEIEILSKIRHKNLLSLLGYCEEDGEKYFVYEYCANGNLSQMLLAQEVKVLTWVQRVKIAYDCITGLRSLHLYSEGCIVHRDIKPTNILLTESMEAKLADFGLLRMFNIQETNVFTEVKGTLGYLDPEYASKGRLTCYSDIYSFGIVLLQLLSGRRAIDIDQSHRESLVKKAKRVCQKNPIDPSKYADPRLNGEYSREAFVILLHLGVLCTASSSQGRPRISVVYEEIEKAFKVSTSIAL